MTPWTLKKTIAIDIVKHRQPLGPAKGAEPTMSPHPVNVAVLDDYQGVATSIVDWSSVSKRANVTVFRDHLSDQDAVAERLAPFDVVASCENGRRCRRPCSIACPN